MSLPRTRDLLAVGLVLVAITSCTPAISHRVPVVSPAGRSEAETDQDTAACERVAPKGIDKRDLTYASCMLERGYTVWTEIPLHGGMTGMGGAWVMYDVTPTRAHARDEAFKDLLACRDVARATVQGDRGAKIATFIAGTPGTAIQAVNVDEDYGRCLAARGYRIERWTPKPDSTRR